MCESHSLGAWSAAFPPRPPPTREEESEPAGTQHDTNDHQTATMLWCLLKTNHITVYLQCLSLISLSGSKNCGKTPLCQFSYWRKLVCSKCHTVSSQSGYGPRYPLHWRAMTAAWLVHNRANVSRAHEAAARRMKDRRGLRRILNVGNLHRNSWDIQRKVCNTRCIILLTSLLYINCILTTYQCDPLLALMLAQRLPDEECQIE